MHWAVVGRAASVSKRRPGPINTQTEEDMGEPIWIKTVRKVPKERDRKERDAYKNHNIARE